MENTQKERPEAEAPTAPMKEETRTLRLERLEDRVAPNFAWGE